VHMFFFLKSDWEIQRWEEEETTHFQGLLKNNEKKRSKDIL